MVADKMILGHVLIVGFSMTDDNLYKVVDSVRKVLSAPATTATHSKLARVKAGQNDVFEHV